MAGWAGSNRRAELPANWAEICARVMVRDRRRCKHVRYDTGRPCNLRATDVDHIVAGGSDDLSNLQALCQYHHRQKSGREGGLASQAARRRREAARPQYRHPGLLP